jgi:hypothetical protein
VCSPANAADSSDTTPAGGPIIIIISSSNARNDLNLAAEVAAGQGLAEFCRCNSASVQETQE